MVSRLMVLRFVMLRVAPAYRFFAFAFAGRDAGRDGAFAGAAAPFPFNNDAISARTSVGDIPTIVAVRV